VLASLEVRNRQATSEKMSYVEFLALVLTDESERREQKKLSLRVRRGGFDPAKTLEVFDSEFNVGINRRPSVIG
jgi:DNA replication protein DnaC